MIDLTIYGSLWSLRGFLELWGVMELDWGLGWNPCTYSPQAAQLMIRDVALGSMWKGGKWRGGQGFKNGFTKHLTVPLSAWAWMQGLVLWLPDLWSFDCLASTKVAQGFCARQAQVIGWAPVTYICPEWWLWLHLQAHLPPGLGSQGDQFNKASVACGLGTQSQTTRWSAVGPSVVQDHP